MSPFDMPFGARPGQDRVLGQDELGRTVYVTGAGQQYTAPLPPRPRMAPGPLQGPTGFAAPDRMAEMRAYAQQFPGRISAEDLEAAGFTPQEIDAFMPMRQPMPAAAVEPMAEQFGTLQAADPTLRENAIARVQDALMQRVGMDAYTAGRYARDIMGDPTASGTILDQLGLADLTPLGAAFAVQEGSRTFERGRETGDPLTMAMGGVEAGLGILEATPLAGVIFKGIGDAARGIDPNTLFTVFGPPPGGRLPLEPPRVEAPAPTAPTAPPAPVTFTDVERAMQEAPAVPGRAPVTPSLGGRAGRISTRFPTAARATEDPYTGELIVGLDELKRDPNVYEFNVNITRDYPNMRPNPDASVDDTAEQFITHVKDNLLYLHDQVPPATRQRSQLWYDGARNITDRWSQEYNVPDTSIAGALAALSPQKDWYQNVSLAQRTLDVVRPRSGTPLAFTPEMEQTFRNIPSLNKPQYGPLLDVIRGKSYDQITDPDPAVQNTLRALFARLHDQTYRSPDYRIVSPEGDFLDVATNLDGSPSRVAWGSLNEIGKAIGSIEASGDVRTISGLMGERHKVRNFYNNIYDPNSPYGDVTIDTHAVAAGLLRPLSGNSLEVDHNFKNTTVAGRGTTKGSSISGVSGNYGLYAEAYRRAAQERGILPRQMQSITWEAVRGLFPDTFKTEKNAQIIDGIWNRYRSGEIEIDEARRMVNEAAGGINPPTWQQ